MYMITLMTMECKIVSREELVELKKKNKVFGYKKVA